MYLCLGSKVSHIKTGYAYSKNTLQMEGIFMAVRKLDTGKWLCECYPAGRNGRRVRKQSPPKVKHSLLNATR